MGFVKEFKEFAFKGNVLDLAVGVIIGAAFGKIVTSLVEDVVTPLLLNPALKAAGAENISKLTWNGVAYGNFLSAVISFLYCLLWFFSGSSKEQTKSSRKKLLLRPDLLTIKSCWQKSEIF